MTGSSVYLTLGMGRFPPWWQGALVLVAYAVGLALLGRFTTLRRDLT